MLTLKEQLQAIKAKSAEKMTPEIVDAVKKGFEALEKQKITDRPLKVGDPIPAFTLPNGEEKMIRSEDLLAQGPLVILFYRGKW